MISFDKYKEEFELPYMNWYRRYLPEIEKARVHAAYIEALKHIPKPRCFPWANGLLEELRRQGKMMAVLSALEEETLNVLITEHGMAGFFTEVMGSVHDKRDAMHVLLDKCGFKKQKTVFIGDMVHDIEAGKAAGIRTFAVTWGYDSRKKLLKADPGIVVGDIEMLRRVLLD